MQMFSLSAPQYLALHIISRVWIAVYYGLVKGGSFA